MKTITTRKDATVDNYHGTLVADPYRWLEDAQSDETRAWSEEQAALTHNYLAQIPIREQLKERLTQLWDYPRSGVPRKEGDRYYSNKNSGLQNQAVLYMSKTFNGEARE